MKTKFLTLALAALTIGLLGSCNKNNGPETPKAPEGALSGKFTVNAEGKQVYFSKGNLYYDGNVFKFETNQYDFPDSWSTSHVGHFYWCKTASAAYAETYSSDGTTKTAVFFTNATKTTAKADFTVNSVTGQYRTLSKEELLYLFNTRTVNGGQGEGKSYSLNITHGDIMGLVIYPDNYSGSVLSGTITSLPEGVVFLPATGHRTTSSITRIGELGDYWSSSAHDDDYSIELHFDSESVSPNCREYYSCAFTVRLVTDVK